MSVDVHKSPRSVQMNIGIQRELRSGMVLTADYLRNISTHTLLALDTNHVGDARFLNMGAATNAIAATLTACGVATIDAAIVNCPGLHSSGRSTIVDLAVSRLDYAYSTGVCYPFSDSQFGV